MPTVLCVEALEALKPGHDFSWVVIPTTHTPIVLPNGLFSSLPQSTGFHQDFFPAIGATGFGAATSPGSTLRLRWRR